MVEQRDRLGLVLEPAQLGVVGQDAGLDHLEGDGAVEADLPRLVDDAHAAAAQLLLDLVVAEVADGGAARQVACGPVAVGRPGRVAEVGRPVARGVGPGRGLRPRQVRERTPRSPRGRSARSHPRWRRRSAPRSRPPCAWLNRQRGQQPSGAFAGSLAPQFGQRFSSVIDGSFIRSEPSTLPYRRSRWQPIVGQGLPLPGPAGV